MIVSIILAIVLGIFGSIIKSYDYTCRSISKAFYPKIYRTKYNFLILLLWILLLMCSIIVLFFINIIFGIAGLILYFTIIPRLIDPIMFQWIAGMTEEKYKEKYSREL